MIEMQYFGPSEFVRGGRDWWPHMDPSLLRLLDQLRGAHGAPISISPSGGALGRPGSGSADHDPKRNGGKVRAADVFPSMIQTERAARDFWELALNTGVSALGVYPHWRDGTGEQRIGYHIGYRPARAGNPAVWGMTREVLSGPQRMVGPDEALRVAGILIPR